MPTALPASSEFTSNTQDQGDMKAVFSALRDFLAGLLGTDGATATALATLGAPLSSYVAKSGAYTAMEGDKGTAFDCTGTWTFGLLAAATAGDGFTMAVRNGGSGVITIDANLTETIDGATTLVVGAGECVVLVCTGTAWVAVAKTVGLSIAIATQAEMEVGTEAELRLMSPELVAQAIAALGSTDIGAGGIGMMGMMVLTSGSVASGATVAGSSLRDMVASSTSGTITFGASARTGTWRNISGVTLTAGAGADAGMFQRIS